MANVALMSVSDGRADVHQHIAEFVSRTESAVAGSLAEQGHTVLRAGGTVTSNQLAVAEARRLASERPDVAIISIPVWAFPNFTVIAAHEFSCPLLLLGTLDPTYPGMVGLLAAGGALDQVGRQHARAWGDVSDPSTRGRLDEFIRASSAAQSLRGSTFGRIGGRPMGMYTAVSDPADWMRKFSVDVEEIDQLELVRRAELVDATKAADSRRWLETHAAAVHYDGSQLTPELLERQIRLYYAMRELIDDHGLTFCGVKAQPELTSHFATMDVAEAFLNDPYDWDGPKQPVICSTEGDMDGALTMQILQRIAGTPVLFADVRHYHSDLGIWDLCNSGQHATWFAARSADPLENLARVSLHPQEFYFPAGGAAVHHLAAPGDFTFARLSRKAGTYRLQVVAGELVQLDAATNRRLIDASTPVWPHAFARLDVSHEEMLRVYGSNHIHAIPGRHVDCLRDVCALLEIEFSGLGAAA